MTIECPDIAKTLVEFRQTADARDPSRDSPGTRRARSGTFLGPTGTASLGDIGEQLFTHPVAQDVVDGAPVSWERLARICGACGASLGRPIAFVGTAEEAARDAFAGPPLHVACVPAVLDLLGASTHQVVHTAGFEFVRPDGSSADRAPRFVPNSLIGPPAH